MFILGGYQAWVKSIQFGGAYISGHEYLTNECPSWGRGGENK
jgi:hypothetical protein